MSMHGVMQRFGAQPFGLRLAVSDTKLPHRARGNNRATGNSLWKTRRTQSVDPAHRSAAACADCDRECVPRCRPQPLAFTVPNLRWRLFRRRLESWNQINSDGHQRTSSPCHRGWVIDRLVLRCKTTQNARMTSITRTAERDIARPLDLRSTFATP